MKTKIEKIQNRIIFGVVVLIISSVCLFAIIQPALDEMQEERDLKKGRVEYDPWTLQLKPLWPQWKEDDYQTLTTIRIINILCIIVGIVIFTVSSIRYLFEIQSKQKQSNQQKFKFCPKCGTQIRGRKKVR